MIGYLIFFTLSLTSRLIQKFEQDITLIVACFMNTSYEWLKVDYICIIFLNNTSSKFEVKKIQTTYYNLKEEYSGFRQPKRRAPAAVHRRMSSAFQELAHRGLVETWRSNKRAFLSFHNALLLTPYYWISFTSFFVFSTWVSKKSDVPIQNKKKVRCPTQSIAIKCGILVFS